MTSGQFIALVIIIVLACGVAILATEHYRPEKEYHPLGILIDAEGNGTGHSIKLTFDSKRVIFSTTERCPDIFLGGKYEGYPDCDANLWRLKLVEKPTVKVEREPLRSE